MKDLRCMSFTSKGTNEIIVAGLQDQMFVIDVNKGEITKEVCLLLPIHGMALTG
jgi:PAB-dependent poly(A)-specific ribonuclease subunit 2